MSTPELPEPPFPRQPRSPGGPTEPLAPVGPPVAGPPVVDRGPVADGRLWWQREMAIVGVGLLMLVVGGLLGYLIGHSNAKPAKTVFLSGTQHTQTQTQTQTTSAPQNTATVTTSTTVAKAKPGTTVTRIHTVTTPGKTVTVASPAHTVTVKATTTVTHTQTVTASTSTSSSATASQTIGSSPQTFSGSNTQNLGTIHVVNPSQLTWSCPGCSSGSFTVSNSSSDPTSLSVNAQGTTNGQLAVPPATYNAVTAQGTGSWTITITPQG